MAEACDFERESLQIVRSCDELQILNNAEIDGEK
jgi:hypothetical protein